MLKHAILFLAFCIGICVSLSSCRHKPAGLPAPARNTKDTLLIYLMAGQSNMAGRGAMEGVDSGTHPRILAIDCAGSLVLAREPLHYFYHPAFAGLDCGRSFATHLLPYIPADSRICLVPCAIGNTRLDEWLHDSSHNVAIYNNLISRAQVAMQRGVLQGVLWHQGESDAENVRVHDYYAADLQQLIGKVRKDLGDESLPFFVATLADFCARPYKDEVNLAIHHVAQTLGHVTVVSTADLSSKADGVHFDAAGQREMGRRFAVAAREELR